MSLTEYGKELLRGQLKAYREYQKNFANKWLSDYYGAKADEIERRLAEEEEEKNMGAFDRFEAAMAVMRCFPFSFMTYQGEIIVHRESNTYFRLADCESDLDVKCKVLEWLSRPAHKTVYAGPRKNKSFHEFILKGINEYLGTCFTEKDMETIYTPLGNACNHALTVQFIESGYDLSLLRREVK